MMQFISVADAMKQGSGTVSIRGWCYRERKSNQRAFIVVRDASNVIQCVVDKATVAADVWEAANKVAVEASLEVSGEIKPDTRAPTGYEIKVETLRLVGPSDAFPITKDQSTEFLLDVRHLWLRSRMLTSVMRVKSAMLAAAREFFEQKKYFEVTPPIITGSSCEGGSTLFELNYFGEKAYLSQSAQLYLESMIFSLEKVWSLTPSFRAEKSRTQRHLAEYWHLEGEEAWLDFNGLLEFEEQLISYICQTVAARCADDLKALGRDPADLAKITPPFPRISYAEAIEILQKEGIELKWGDDLGTEHERVLSMKFEKPLMIMRYPKDIKAFYMKQDAADPKVVLCCDVLAPEGYGEIIGSSERETDYNEIVRKLEAQGEKIEHYAWYLDLRKYGSVPHSGFGLGIERVLRWICKLESIRDAIPYPRTITRKYP